MSQYKLDTPFSSQVVFLDSNNSIFRSINGEGSYVFNFDTPIVCPFNCQMIISVTDAQFPNVIPLFNDTNNKLFFYVPTFDRLIDITIPSTIYGVDDFLRYVNKQIQLQANGLFSLYGAYENFRIIWYGNYVFDILNSDIHPTTCLDLIGGKKDQFGDYKNAKPGRYLEAKLNPAYNITMPSVVDFTGTRFIFFKLKNVSVNNMNSFGRLDNAVVRIDNNVTPGGMIFYRPLEVQKFLINKKVIQNLNFVLTDTKDNNINIFSSNSYITLKIDFIYVPQQREVDEGTLSNTIRKLGKIPDVDIESRGVYNPETNQFIRN